MEYVREYNLWDGRYKLPIWHKIKIAIAFSLRRNYVSRFIRIDRRAAFKYLLIRWLQIFSGTPANSAILGVF